MRERVEEAICKSGGKAMSVKANIAKEGEPERLVAEMKRVFGPIDMLVNNAGVNVIGALTDITAADFHRHFDLNVLTLLLGPVLNLAR